MPRKARNGLKTLFNERIMEGCNKNKMIGKINLWFWRNVCKIFKWKEMEDYLNNQDDYINTASISKIIKGKSVAFTKDGIRPLKQIKTIGGK